MPGGERIDVSEFVDEHELGSPRQNGIEVHLADPAAIGRGAMVGDDFQFFQQSFYFFAAVRLDCADDDIHSLAVLADAGTDHFAGRADTRCSTQEDLEAAASLWLGHFATHLRRAASVEVGVRRLPRDRFRCLHDGLLGSCS
jgi:hypothetical protein